MVTLSFKELLSFCLNNDEVDAKDYTCCVKLKKNWEWMKYIVIGISFGVERKISTRDGKFQLN